MSDGVTAKSEYLGSVTVRTPGGACAMWVRPRYGGVVLVTNETVIHIEEWQAHELARLIGIAAIRWRDELQPKKPKE